MPRVFPYTVLIHTDFFPKLLIFMVFYTDLCQVLVAGLVVVYFTMTTNLCHALLFPIQVFAELILSLCPLSRTLFCLGQVHCQLLDLREPFFFNEY